MNFPNGRLTIDPKWSPEEIHVIETLRSIAIHYRELEPKIMEMLKEFKQENPEIEVSQRN